MVLWAYGGLGSPQSSDFIRCGIPLTSLTSMMGTTGPVAHTIYSTPNAQGQWS